MARSTAEAFNIVCRLDHDGKFDEVLQENKQKVATSLFCGNLHATDFVGQIYTRVSKVLGPICRYRVAGISSHVKLASRFSRPGLTAHLFQRVICGSKISL